MFIRVPFAFLGRTYLHEGVHNWLGAIYSFLSRQWCDLQLCTYSTKNERQTERDSIVRQVDTDYIRKDIKSLLFVNLNNLNNDLFLVPRMSNLLLIWEVERSRMTQLLYLIHGSENNLGQRKTLGVKIVALSYMTQANMRQISILAMCY